MPCRFQGLFEECEGKGIDAVFDLVGPGHLSLKQFDGRELSGPEEPERFRGGQIAQISVGHGRTPG